jgi:lipopolysaccharide transport system permease protein
MTTNADARTARPDSAGGPVTLIRPQKGWIAVNLKEVWAYRELLYFLTWRDIKVRYKQTVIGFAWAVLQPILMTTIFTLFFGILAAIPSQGVPYALYIYTALVPWGFFANGVTRASGSLIYDAALIQKVYFPRLLLPLAGILSPLLDFFFAFLVLIGLIVYFHYAPGVAMLALLPFLLLAGMFTLGIGLWLAAINVEYRDVGQIVPFLVQLLFFASPVIYPSSFVPARFQVAYGLLNPMSGVIEGFRWAILGTKPPGLLMLASAGIIVLILVSGVFYFRSREKAFADVV